jgi:predicted enzyme related to lactoylglutathione lyase
MPTIDAHDPGTICWVDLASTDAGAATEFYCELFGWSASDPLEGAGGYRLLLRGGHQVAGLAPVWGDTDRSSWSTYVATDDADRTCSIAVASGGDVVLDAMDVLDAGRMAMLRDPGGALISVWQAGAHRGYEVHDEPRAPSWTELVTPAGAAAVPFYSAVFGWTADLADREEPGYTIWRRRERVVGGMAEMDEIWPADAPAQWVVSFGSADCDASARRCRELGGAVLHAPATVGPRRRALLEDPSGAVFSVVTPGAGG